MSKRTGFVFAGAVTSLLSGSALAQPPPASGDLAPPAASPGGPAAAAAEAPAEPPASRYPRDIISRPLTYPAGLAAGGFDLTSATTSFADPATVRLLVGYGITDDLELNFGHYAFPTDHADKGSFDFGAGMKLVRGAIDGKLEIIGRVQSGYSLASEGLNPLLVGLHAQYNITPAIAVYTPGGQLSVALSGDPKPATFGLPVSIGVQATRLVWVQLDTTLATFKLANAANTFAFADTTPVAVTASVNPMPRVDLVVGVAANLTPPSTMDAAGNAVTPKLSDTFAVMVGARYYLGAL